MKLDKSAALAVIAAALKEDVGPKDLTTWALIPKGQFAKGELVVREEGVVAGLPLAEWTFWQVDSKIRFKPTVRDAETVHPGKVVAFVEGPAQGILTAERTALNFLSRLSGIATLTRRFVDQVARWKTPIMDTRKTTPTLRALEKYAVAAGGGVPHRMGLYDQVLIKDNHIQLVAARHSVHRVSAIEEAVKEARSKFQKNTTVEVEVTNLQEFRQALSARADILLLDNMTFADIQEAVRLRNALSRSGKERRPLLEVSGGVTLETVSAVAGAGVDRISIGALTRSAVGLDAALELVG
ncbi:MAG: carboxylating nicotinate-nucleotide diphosphorylase [Candidatus Omnitrophica bacterium]|nr:carboxylating nicotinate-nucleotide diphosphorylase [Candidatus Omnitrophota bacterium]